MGRGLRVASVLAGGGAVGAALYWALLNTPESNALMLALSALLAMAIVAVAAITINTVVLIARDVPVRQALSAGPRGAGWFVIACTPLAAAWIAISRFDAWMVAHQGEINAWFIARYGWADITALTRAELWISRWLRWALLPTLCLSLLAALLTRDRASWLRRALHWRTLTVVTVAFGVLMALPWQLTAWHPALPATWVQPALAAVRLGVAFVLGLTGVSVLVIAAARGAALSTPSSTRGGVRSDD